VDDLDIVAGLNGLCRDIASGQFMAGYQVLILQVFGANRPLEGETVLSLGRWPRIAPMSRDIEIPATQTALRQRYSCVRNDVC